MLSCVFTLVQNFSGARFPPVPKAEISLLIPNNFFHQYRHPCRNVQTQLLHYAAGVLHYNAAGVLHYNAAGALHYNAAGVLHYNAAGALHYNAAGVLHYNAAVHCTFFRRRLLSSCGSSLF